MNIIIKKKSRFNRSDMVDWQLMAMANKNYWIELNPIIHPSLPAMPIPPEKEYKTNQTLKEN
jgi:hypothetical protein